MPRDHRDPSPPRDTNKTATMRVRAGAAGEPIVQQMEASSATAFQPEPWGAWLVGAAAHPVGGEDSHIRFDVEVGCCVEIRSFAPTVSRPGPIVSFQHPLPIPSSCTTNVTVATDALLAWCPEPGVASNGSEHRNTATVKLASNSRLVWRDEFLLDRRTDEPTGTWHSRLRVTRDGWPVVSSEMAIGPASTVWPSPAVFDRARAVASVVIVDPDHPRQTWSCERAAAEGARGVSLPLSGPGAQFIVWASELSVCRNLLRQMLGAAGAPRWAVDRIRFDNEPRPMLVQIHS